MSHPTSPYRTVTDETLMETLQHGSHSYPFQFYNENLALFDFHCIEWHWHTEVEFVFIQSGTVTFWIGEKSFQLSKGSGVFINSRVLHRLSSPSEAIIPNFLFMPDFIAASDSRIYQKYILPVISSPLSFQILQPATAWQNEMLHIMNQIIACQAQEDHELTTSSLTQALWNILYKNADISNVNPISSSSAASQAKLQWIMQYIHQYYSSDISLDEIAVHARMSKSSVLNLFRKYLHTTPIHYLIQYRLNEAAFLLSKTEKSIAAISLEAGFNHVDYFCRLFKEHYHLTPTQYRKKKNG